MNKIKVLLEITCDENVAKAYSCNDKVELIDEISRQLLKSQISFTINDLEQDVEYVEFMLEQQEKYKKMLENDKIIIGEK